MPEKSLTVEQFIDVVASVGGAVSIALVRTHEGGRERRPQVTVTLGGRTESATAPTKRMCCDRLLPWVQAQARRMEARS